MDTVTTFPRSQVEPIRPSGAPAAPVADRLVTVMAIYELTEDGRKASLLGGGDGRAIQKATLEVPASRLHLVAVDADGMARLKLRPRYHLDALQRVVRVDAPPSYDTPPTPEDLLKEAARNHQLERAYAAERTATREKRREATRETRNHIAQQFLSDRTQRPLRYPVPTPEQCYLAGPEGRLRFDVASDDGPAKQVPPEAHGRSIRSTVPNDCKHGYLKTQSTPAWLSRFTTCRLRSKTRPPRQRRNGRSYMHFSRHYRVRCSSCVHIAWPGKAIRMRRRSPSLVHA